MPISIRVVGASPSARIGLYAKPVGDYSMLPMVAVEATGSTVSLTPQTNTERINAALGIGTDHELDHLDMMCEIVYSEAGKQVATATLSLVLHNNVARPGLPDDQLQDDPYQTGDIPIATTEVAGKVKPDGSTITIDQTGTLTAAKQSIPLATAATAGIVRPDGNTIKIDAGGSISTSAIRSIAGYRQCEVTLGASLNATVTAAEQIRLDVVGLGASDKSREGLFMIIQGIVETIELEQGTYEVDIIIDCKSCKSETTCSIKYRDIDIPPYHILGYTHTAQGGMDSFAHQPIPLTINTMTDSKYVTIHAVVDAQNVNIGRLSIALATSEAKIIEARYRRVGN